MSQSFFLLVVVQSWYCDDETKTTIWSQTYFCFSNLNATSRILIFGIVVIVFAKVITTSDIQNKNILHANFCQFLNAMKHFYWSSQRSRGLLFSKFCVTVISARKWSAIRYFNINGGIYFRNFTVPHEDYLFCAFQRYEHFMIIFMINLKLQIYIHFYRLLWHSIDSSMSMDSSSPLSNTLLTTGIEACSSLVSMVSSLGSSLVGWFGLVWSIRHIVWTVLLLENGLRPATISRTIWHSTNSVPTWDHQCLNPPQKLIYWLRGFVLWRLTNFHLLFNAFAISSFGLENVEVWRLNIEYYVILIFITFFLTAQNWEVLLVKSFKKYIFFSFV